MTSFVAPAATAQFRALITVDSLIYKQTFRMHPGETAFLTFRLHGTIPAATARALKAALAQAPPAGTDHHRARKQLFAAFDAVLDRGPIGPRYFENEKMAEVLAGEILMLEETGFTVHGFAILPNHAHLVLHLPARSGLSFAKALDLLHVRTDQHCRRLVRPKLPPEAAFWQPGWKSPCSPRPS